MLHPALIACLILATQAQAQQSFDTTVLQEIDTTIQSAIDRNQIPGGVLWLENIGASPHVKAYGNRALLPQAEPMTTDTIFDIASLTKVVATLPAIMQLIESGKIELTDKVQKHIPELTGDTEKADITIQQLLTHVSGLFPGVRRGYDWQGYDHGIALAASETIANSPDSTWSYSDINFILLGEIVHRVSGKPLDRYTADNIFAPLQMSDTTFLSSESNETRIAPTTQMPDGSILRGTVHDPTARSMGGVAGHAGVFSTAADLAKYARSLLSTTSPILKKTTIDLMTSVQTPPWITARRGLGWDIDSPYATPRGNTFPIGSYGHTGWTGTSLWIDPFSRSFIIFLSNRNHPTESGTTSTLRETLGTLAARALQNFDFTSVPVKFPPVSNHTVTEAKARFLSKRGKVQNGIDVLRDEKFATLNGLKVGLVTNHTGIARDKKSTIDLLHEAKNVQLKALFSPEHGLRGTMDQTEIKDSIDRKTGLKVYSLYAGPDRKPKAPQLAGLDALVFDIQDIGCRFYTYISTMGLCMEAAQEAGIRFIVLDRVNPIGGDIIDGPVRAGAQEFIAFHNIPLRHGMTVGELAKMFQSERYGKCHLTVVPVKNWKRSQLFDKTGLPWINPSPNMRNLVEAILYPGVGMLEFTNLSVGRGTKMPFELVGAPFIDPDKFATALKSAKLPGLDFVPITYTPESSVYANQKCGGVRILLKDPYACHSVDLGITIATILHQQHPKDWQTKNLGKLLMHPPTEQAILTGKSLPKIHATWSTERTQFEKRRRAFLIYD
jgi:uncharacterized protein YbbC (DUF1343 family)/CubicO group peptidase (beta-lactamase class C family)